MTARQLRGLVAAASAWADVVDPDRRSPLNTRTSRRERREIAANLRGAVAELGRLADRAESLGNSIIGFETIPMVIDMER